MPDRLRRHQHLLRRRRRAEDLARAVRLQRPDQPRRLHGLDQPGSAVVADLQAALDAGDRGLAGFGDDAHRLVVQRVGSAIRRFAVPALLVVGWKPGDRRCAGPPGSRRCRPAARQPSIRPPRDAPLGRRRRHRGRASEWRCPAAGTACRHDPAATPRRFGRGWCASRPWPRPGRRCGSGMLALMRPVITSTEGRWVARIRWMPEARAFWARRAISSSTFLPTIIMRSASSSMITTMNGKRGQILARPRRRCPERPARSSACGSGP